MELQDEEKEEPDEESQNKDKDSNMSSTVNELSEAQLQLIISILQISHPGTVANVMALINPTSRYAAAALMVSVNPFVQHGTICQSSERNNITWHPCPGSEASSHGNVSFVIGAWISEPNGS